MSVGMISLFSTTEGKEMRPVQSQKLLSWIKTPCCDSMCKHLAIIVTGALPSAASCIQAPLIFSSLSDSLHLLPAVVSLCTFVEAL